jgi:hypothetical protein
MGSQFRIDLQLELSNVPYRRKVYRMSYFDSPGPYVYHRFAYTNRPLYFDGIPFAIDLDSCRDGPKKVTPRDCALIFAESGVRGR